MDEEQGAGFLTRITIWLRAHGSHAALAIIAGSLAAAAIWGGRDSSYAVLMLGIIGAIVALRLK